MRARTKRLAALIMSLSTLVLLALSGGAGVRGW